MKLCNGCSTEKDYLEFHKNKTKKDGYASSCKVCHSASNKAWIQANPEKKPAMDKAYRQANPERHAANNKADRLRNPEKHKARMAVGIAIKAGTLTRPQECSSCNVSCVPDGHHDDYGKPLDIRWLCRTCHVAHHTQLNELQEA